MLPEILNNPLPQCITTRHTKKWTEERGDIPPLNRDAREFQSKPNKL